MHHPTPGRSADALGAHGSGFVLLHGERAEGGDDYRPRHARPMPVPPDEDFLTALGIADTPA